MGHVARMEGLISVCMIRVKKNFKEETVQEIKASMQNNTKMYLKKQCVG